MLVFPYLKHNRLMGTAANKTAAKTLRAKRAAPPYHHGDLRNAMLREGRALLEAAGATEISMAEIARRVGVSDAAPFRHFEDKESLFAAIAAEGFRELSVQQLAVAALGLDRLETLRKMLLNYVRYAQQNKGVFNLMFGPRILDPHRHAELKELGAQSYQLFSDAVTALALEHGWSPRHLELVTHSAWAMEHGLATLILAHRAPSRNSQVEMDKMVDFAVAMALSAISAGPTGIAKRRVAKVKPGAPGRPTESV